MTAVSGFWQNWESIFLKQKHLEKALETLSDSIAGSSKFTSRTSWKGGMQEGIIKQSNYIQIYDKQGTDRRKETGSTLKG